MIEKELIGIIGLVLMLMLLLARIPVGLAMVLVGITGNYALSKAVSHLRFQPYLEQYKTLLWHLFSSYQLSLIPLFVLMGYLALYSGLSRSLFQGIAVILRPVKGGAAYSVILAAAGFSAVCGSSLATTAAIGKLALPELKKLQYEKGFRAAVTAVGGVLGILIPPSIVLIIYSIIVEASIVKMFQAAILPSLLAVFFFSISIFITLRLKPHAILPKILPKNIVSTPSPMPVSPLSKREQRKAIISFIPLPLIFIIIFAGLAFGFFTPTPTASIAVLIILIYGLLQTKHNDASKGLNKKRLLLSFEDSAKTTAMIYFILFGAEVLKGFLSRSGLPAYLAEAAAMSQLNPWITLSLILFMLILLGCFMESLSMILIVIPFLWPILIDINGGNLVSANMASFGMNAEDLKIWFGILALIVVELGLITPPMGLSLFIILSFDKSIRMQDAFYGLLPFLGFELLRIALIMAFPVIVFLLL